MKTRIRGFFGWLDRVPMRVADFFYVLTAGGEEARRSRGREREGFALYFSFLAVEVFLGGAARWLITSVAIVWIDLIIPLGGWIAVMPWVVALRRPVWSVAALAHVGGHGDERLDPDVVHRPDEAEAQQLLGAMVDLWTYDVNISMPERILIVECPIAGAMVRRDTLFFTTAAMQSPALPALLGHELSHLRSSDPWLGVAVDRLGSGIDPYPGIQLEYMRGAWKLFGLLCLPGHWAIRLARGGVGTRMLSSRWTAYKLARELTADAYAASLGQAGLTCWYLRSVRPEDDGPSRLIDALTFHPSVAERIARLQALPRPVPFADLEDDAAAAVLPREAIRASVAASVPSFLHSGCDPSRTYLAGAMR
ncbi:MAG TPA: M48 family metalloprotease [Solirubrobacterales bacterium]|jgi:Zn-dependent protease with chaperone function